MPDERRLKNWKGCDYDSDWLMSIGFRKHESGWMFEIGDPDIERTTQISVSFWNNWRRNYAVIPRPANREQVLELIGRQQERAALLSVAEKMGA